MGQELVTRLGLERQAMKYASVGWRERSWRGGSFDGKGAVATDFSQAGFKWFKTDYETL